MGASDRVAKVNIRRTNRLSDNCVRTSLRKVLRMLSTLKT